MRRGPATRIAAAARRSSLLAAMLAANVGNYLANLLLGRWLTPDAYGEVSLVITLVLVLSVIASAISQAMARVTAEALADSRPARIATVRAAARRAALRSGVVGGLAIVALAPAMATWFHLAQPLSIAMIGLGLPLFLVQAVDRGVLQGRARFARLGGSFLAEATARLGVGTLFVAAGFGAPGAVVGVLASFVASWLVARDAGRGLPEADPDEGSLDRLLAEAGPIAAVLIGQVVLANADLLVVKAALPPLEAGHYAAVVLVGRAVLFIAAPIAAVVFPLVVSHERLGTDTGTIVGGSTLFVGLLVLPPVVISALAPEAVLGALFGPRYLPGAAVLGPYVAAAALGAISWHLASVMLAKGDRRASLLTLSAAGVQLGLLAGIHARLGDVVLVVLGVQATLAIASAGLVVTSGRRARTATRPSMTAEVVATG